MRIPKPKYIILIGAVCGAFTLQTGLGGIISVTGTNSSNEPLAATANFTFGLNTLSLTLSNDILNTDWISAGQALSDFTFTLSDGSTSGGSLNNISGNTINVDLQGNVTSGAPVSATDWQLQVVSGDTFHLTSLIMGQPDFMIAPAGTSFPNVNHSVQNFNPYLLTGPVVFSITGDFPAGTTVSSASFSFGTGPETIIPGHVPDSGATAMLLGIALTAAGVVRRFAII